MAAMKTTKHAAKLFPLLCPVMAAACALAAAAPADPLDESNVVWESPSKNSAGSMPLGNGDVGLNVWVEEGGDLVFYVSKTDAWDGLMRLLKLGRVRVQLSPNPFVAGQPFRQTLRLRQGEIEIVAGPPAEAVTIRIWVDANLPVVRIEATGARPFDVRANLEVWRTKAGPLEGKNRDAARGVLNSPEPMVATPDTVLDDPAGRLVWFHRNTTSCWPVTMKVQGLDGLVKPEDDPLLGRTFGGAIAGGNFAKESPTALKSKQAARQHAISIYALTKTPATQEEWLAELGRVIKRVDSTPGNQARAAHFAWWDAFWNRSWIRVSGTSLVTQGYTLQRFINACGGRGAMPIKFNGSIFTVDIPGADGDYRRWGGCFWFQNTRLPYWSMPACGDYDLMPPLFKMYTDALPFRKAVTRLYYNHDGAFFDETICFWGTPCNDDYRWKRDGAPASLLNNPYIMRYWQGGLELAMMMLDTFDHTQDKAFAAKQLVPLADAVVTFYDKHYPREAGGQLRFEPAQSLETWWKAVNPMPEVAGLRAVLPRLVALPENLATPAQRREWQRILAQVPPVPLREEGGKKVLAAAQEFSNHHNRENPELYAIFPYRLYGVGRPDLAAARGAFEVRIDKGSQGWQQDPVQSAMLGLADEAAKFVTKRFSTHDRGSRFPAFWGPNFDWVPDQDHGANGMMALQAMLLQSDGRKLLLFPAWPKTWDVEFKLHAPLGTTVEGVYRGGRLERLSVTPPERAKDVVQMEPQ
jgi:hypothetical protein